MGVKLIMVLWCYAYLITLEIHVTRIHASYTDFSFEVYIIYKFTY